MGNRSITVRNVRQAKPPVRETSRDEKKEMAVVIVSTGSRFAISEVVSENGLNGETCHFSCGEMSALDRADIWPHLVERRDVLRVKAVSSNSDRTDWHAVEVVAWGPACPSTVKGEMCLGTYYPYDLTYEQDDGGDGEKENGNSSIHVIELDEEGELRAGITPKAVRRLGLNPNTPVVCWMVENTNPDFSGDLPYFANWVRKVAEAGEEPPAVLDLSLAGNGLHQV